MEIDSDELFRNLFHTLTQGVVFQAPPDGRIVEVNMAAEGLLGRSREALIGQHLYDPVWQTTDASGQPLRAEHTPCARAFHQRAAVRNIIVGFYHPGRQERRWLSVDAFPQYQPSSQEPHLVCALFTDITQQYQAEQALRESELRFRALIEASAQIVWTTDAAGRVSEDSPSWRAFTGQAVDAWLASPTDAPAGWVDMIHPDERDQTWGHWRAAVRQQTPTEGRFRVWHAASGEWHWTAMRAVPLLHSDGSVRGWVGMNTDVDKQQRAQEALTQSTERYRALAANLPGGAAFEVDTRLRYTLAEGEALHTVGARTQDFVGKTIHEALSPEQVGAYEPLFRQALAGEPFHHEHTIEDRHFASRGTPLRNEQGDIYAMLAVSYDITDHKQTEQALRQAKQVAEQAAQAKETFLAHMSHEIRTPLNAVVGLSDLLLQQSPRSDQRENLQTLKFSAQNLRMLVDDILDFSKIQAGKAAVEATEVSLTDLLSNLQKAHQPLADRQHTVLEFHTDPGIPTIIRTDPLKLSQVLNNLISNALKFTKQGTVTVEAQLSAKEAPMAIDFSVADTGIGITQDQQGQIFDAFTQADSSTARQYGGTGLGLSIIKLLLELLGSRIQMESQPGRGSRFFFTLPVHSEAAVPPAVAPAPSLDDMSGIKMLLAEDIAINRMILTQFTQNWWQLNPDQVSNGQEALEAARRTQYDLILMDVRMPTMDGYEATRQIRALPHGAYQHVPILALTADTQQEVAKHCSDHLFTDVITKPFDPEELRRKITQYVAGNETATS